MLGELAHDEQSKLLILSASMCHVNILCPIAQMH